MPSENLPLMTVLKRAATYLDQLIARSENAMAKKLASHERAVADILEDGFLPNFCNGWAIFNVAVIAEMLAIVIALVSPQLPIAQTMLGNLLLISLFIQ